MQPQRTEDGAPTPQPPAPVVPQRSARRATARRASNRRATARRRKDHIEERIIEYLDDHPLSTTGELAKGLNADRAKVAAGRSHIARAGETRGTTRPDDHCAQAPRPRDLRGARLRARARADHHSHVG
jgi:hypothetical protein